MSNGNLVFDWPWVLWGLCLIPLLIGWFLWSQHKFWRDAFAFSQVSVVKTLKQQKLAVWHQRIFPLLLIVGLAIGIVGLAGPTLQTRIASKNSYLMLVMDISISMEATDLSPNRLEASKIAAIEFVKELPKDVKIGLEFFAGNSYLVSQPTENHLTIIEYLKSLKLEDLRPSTAIGDALIVGVDGLKTALTQATQNQDKTQETKKPPPQGTIILMTDGESNLGISPFVAVENAIKQNVTVFTVGIGETAGTFIRGGVFTHLDEPTLKTIAIRTNGQYYRVRSFNDFKAIYDQIAKKTLVYEEKRTPLMPWFLLGTLLVTLAAFGWGVWHRRF